MLSSLERISAEILRREEERRRRAEAIRERFPDLFYAVEPGVPEGTVAAVDGGILAESYHGFEIVVTRAVGVVFRYEDGKMVDVKYYPSPLPDPRIEHYDSPVEEDQITPLRSLMRLKEEIGLAIEVVRHFDVDYLFLDGSVLPLMSDKPREEGLMDFYERVIRLYRELFKTCEERGAKLCGIVKDSRGDRFCSYVGETGRDVTLLFHAMRAGEATYPIPYAEEPDKRATLRDVGREFAEKVWVFYLKASDYDLPYRVEYYGEGPEEGTSIASFLLPLSSLNRTFTIPPFLVEADLRARLGKRDLKYVREYIEKRIGPAYIHLRMRGANKPM